MKLENLKKMIRQKRYKLLGRDVDYKMNGKSSKFERRSGLDGV